MIDNRLCGLVVHEAFELSRADWVLELTDGLGFDLADTLAGDFEDSPDLFQCVSIAVAYAVAELDNLTLAIGKGFQHHINAVFEHFLRCRGDR